MDKLKHEKRSYVFKVTLSSALISVFCLFLLIDTKKNLDVSLIKLYAILVGVGLLFGGLIGFFLSLYLWGKIKSKQVEPSLKNSTESQTIKNKIWNVYIELLSFIAILACYSSLFLGRAFESNKLMFIFLYLGTLGFFITLIVFKLYKWILQLKHKKVANTLIFKILYIIFGICISISIILFVMLLA